MENFNMQNIFYNPNLFAICTKYNKQMGGNRNKQRGRELSSAALIHMEEAQGLEWLRGDLTN
jgi:hypothetical protein